MAHHDPIGLITPAAGLAQLNQRSREIFRQIVESYLATDAWEGKAGAFGYQDGLDWVHITEGSESNVVGLPLELLSRMLADIFTSKSEKP